jgi:2-keto-4-pentenoate hydratase/2-oxohepta-3-ene-1,7-dioic acid hydratase in catechol pathway
MKLIRFGEPGRERPGLQLADGRRVDVSAFGEDYDERFFGDGGLDRLRNWASSSKEASRAPEVAAGARLGPPVGRPSKIVCIGLNYRDHAAESGMAIPQEPVVFFKSTTSIVGPNDALVIPRNARKVDWEVELAVVIGRKAAYVTEDRALDHVAGYVLHNDYSEREFQLERGGQWVKGKSADTFAPLGPFLATPDEIVDVGRLDMWLSVNNVMRQKSTTANMIFAVPALVSYVSQFMTLLPGDVISTGTPAGVGLGLKPTPVFLRPGDVVALGIAGLGDARQEVNAYQETIVRQETIDRP